MLVQLTGISHLASQGHTLAEKKSVEYRSLPTRKWLNRCRSQRVPFHWTINPYRGCEFGCKYCYARFTHEFLELHDPKSFETEIYAKDWDGQSFRSELGAIRPGDVIGLGTATDPYQPAERRFGRTRQLLEALQEVRDVSLFVTTKSDLVSRDADLFRKLGVRNQVRVTLTVTTTDAELARLTEPLAPRPDLRLGALRSLARAGVAAGAIASPVLPLLTDSEEQLHLVASKAKEAGATSFSAGVLFLQPAARQTYFEFLQEFFPQHLARYKTNYRSGAFLRGGYAERISRTVERIRRELGFPARDLAFRVSSPLPTAQLRLF